MAQYYSNGHTRRKIGDNVRRYVVKNEQGNLAIVSTSGATPDGVVCIAKDEWIIDELSFDEVAGIVYVDPAKLKAKEDARLKQKYLKEDIEKKKKKKLLMAKIKVYAILVTIYLMGMAAGFVIGLKF